MNPPDEQYPTMGDFECLHRRIQDTIADVARAKIKVQPHQGSIPEIALCLVEYIAKINELRKFQHEMDTMQYQKLMVTIAELKAMVDALKVSATNRI